MLVPTIYPRSFKARTKAATWTAASGSFSAMFMSTPIRRICSGCCARRTPANGCRSRNSIDEIAAPHCRPPGSGQTGGLEVVKSALSNVRFGSIADICGAKRHVRFAPKSGYQLSEVGCPLSAIHEDRGSAFLCQRQKSGRSSSSDQPGGVLLVQPARFVVEMVSRLFDT